MADPVFVTHHLFRMSAFGAHHPLSTARYPAVLDICDALGWFVPVRTAVASMAEREILERFHDAAYVAAVADVTAQGIASPEQRARYHLGSMECPVFPNLYDRARTTVGGAMLAAELALQGRVAFFPAGGTHHGRSDRASGFCYFNDPVFAILRLLDAGLQRVAYVDLDAHHGDGVEIAFALDPRVTLVSLHEEGRWPGTGLLTDTCDGRALNIPLPRGICDAEYRAIVDAAVLPFLRRAEPEAIVMVLGADGLKGDPLSSMNLMNSTLWRVAQDCLALVPRAVVLGGGGYNPWTTARLWSGFWGLISGFPMPDRLPMKAVEVLDALTCDLVDDEDRDPIWIERLFDPPLDAAIRPEVYALIDVLRARLT